MAGWSVYMIECCDGSLYTGITTDVQRRFRQHQAGLGAKYFRARRPLNIAYLEGGHDKGSASRREAAIKKLTRAQKLVLIAERSLSGVGE
ncbi:GIY-YIG nuclease family protein [Methylomonas koyamae]|uniref:GIY-YIG nuclease family protein n=1 Tax=Methylomonas koyamae TaxID=702114 RepID=UPI001128AE39|nr:GIY-YIG nuclease family protein [Methylomonas koyamae]TPQ26868.1 GIY-YIG nuclease family protein [Methylomonas koyamae]